MYITSCIKRVHLFLDTDICSHWILCELLCFSSLGYGPQPQGMCWDFCCPGILWLRGNVIYIFLGLTLQDLIFSQPQAFLAMLRSTDVILKNPEIMSFYQAFSLSTSHADISTLPLLQEPGTHQALLAHCLEDAESNSLWQIFNWRWSHWQLTRRRAKSSHGPCAHHSRRSSSHSHVSSLSWPWNLKYDLSGSGEKPRS